MYQVLRQAQKLVTSTKKVKYQKLRKEKSESYYELLINSQDSLIQKNFIPNFAHNGLNGGALKKG